MTGEHRYLRAKARADRIHAWNLARFLRGTAWCARCYADLFRACLIRELDRP